jgi:hypothetical protein
MDPGCWYRWILHIKRPSTSQFISTTWTSSLSTTTTTTPTMKTTMILNQTSIDSMNTTGIIPLNNSTIPYLNMKNKQTFSLPFANHQNNYQIAWILLSIFLLILSFIIIVVCLIKYARRYKCYNLSSINDLSRKSLLIITSS